MKPRVIVVGAGPAGLAGAQRLRERGGDQVDVTLIAPERRASFLAGTLDVALGLAAAEEFSATVSPAGVSVIAAHAARVSAGGVRILGSAAAGASGAAGAGADGELLAADAVIAAPGLALRDRPQLPTWPRAVWAWDPWGAGEFARLLSGPAAAARHEPGAAGTGRVLIAAAGLPYRCPPAPFALAIRIAERQQSAGAPVRVTVAVPEPVPLAGVGGGAPQHVLDACAHAGVRVEVGFAPDLAASSDGLLTAMDGRSIGYDAALLIPPHDRPACLAGLPGDGPLVPVDAHGSVAGSNLFVVGDAAATGMPRAAGVGACNARIAADTVLSRLGVVAAPEPEPVTASCFMFHAGGLASRIRVTYSSEPAVDIDGPSAELLGERELERARFLASASAPAG